VPIRIPKSFAIVLPESPIIRPLNWLLVLSLVLAAPTLKAQDETFVPDTSYNEAPEVSEASPSSTKGSDEDDDNIIKVPKQPDPPPAKQFTTAETQKVCAKYRGALLSVYGEIYKLQNCTRHQIHDQEEIFKFAKEGIKTIEVDSKEVAALPIGDNWEVVNAKNRPCSFFNKKYITFSYTDIYFVENCVRKLIPDYETLLEHRKSQGIKSSEVLALNAREFYQIRQGRDVNSVIDREFSKLLEGSAGVDIVPIDEACKGVEGKIVTFYSRMYKIEKCRKREINAEKFTMHRKLNDSKLIELRPEQWVSMPDGKPFDDKK
jgi:hypothetical protein